jgi:hypothetical protein
MEHYAGIDVSLELSSVCVVDAKGKIVKEAKISSDPVALVTFFRGLGIAIERIGLEAGPLSQWLHAGLTQDGHGDAQKLRGAGPRIMRRPFDAGTDLRCDVGGAIRVANRVHQAA